MLLSLNMHGVQLSLNIAPPAAPAPEPPPPPPYTVRLRDSDFGQRERFEAENRFARSFEDKLGTPMQIRDILRTLQDAEYVGRALTEDEQALARKWKRRTWSRGKRVCKAWPRSRARGSKSRCEHASAMDRGSIRRGSLTVELPLVNPTFAVISGVRSAAAQ